jgi:hypothetical protein
MLQDHEAALLQKLNSNVDAFDSYFEADSADAPVLQRRSPAGSQSSSLTRSKGNPSFSAQFDISFNLKFFTLTSGTYTAIAASSLNAGLKSIALPAFLFGWNDWKAGFAKLKNQFNVSPWVYGRPGIYGKDSFSELAFDANVTPSLINGDLVIPFTSALPGTGTTTLALVIVRCTQVAYGTLLESLASDKFVMNMIRYVVPDTTQPSLNQYANNIGLFKQSLFGKFDSDFLSPNSYKKPEQQQVNLIDIPLKRGIDKEKSVAFLINYDIPGSINWSTFVWSVHKL